MDGSLTDHSFEDGKREGKLNAMEAIQRRHEGRLDKHEKRLQQQERITYGLLGAIALIEFLPVFKAAL